MSLIGSLMRTLTERSAANRSIAQIEESLRASGIAVADRFASAPDTPGNRNAAQHIIGIERWGQHRLGSVLGGKPVMDEYDGYRPDDLDSMAALADAFRTTRADTLALADQLRQIDGIGTRTVPHNDMGEVTSLGWLAYLDGHASRESRRVR